MRRANRNIVASAAVAAIAAGCGGTTAPAKAADADAGRHDAAADAPVMYAEAGAAESGEGGDRGPGEDAEAGGGCTPGTTRCSGNSLVTCGNGGTWGAPWPCTTGTCSGPGCTGSTTEGASCVAGGDGVTNCGAATENCCTSLEVPGGTFFRTYTSDADGGPVGEADPATVGSLRLDKYLVTVGRFRQFVRAVLPADGGTGWRPAAGSGKHTHLNAGAGVSLTAGGYESGWMPADDVNIDPSDQNLNCEIPGFPSWTPAPGTNERLPMNCTTWWEAFAFCIWDGGFLPTEAEWGYVAAGGSEQREYPWGTASPGMGNDYAIYNCLYPSLAGPPCTSVANIAPIGTAWRGVGRWGQIDLAGGIWEWNVDSYIVPYVNPCDNCTNLSPAPNRVRRGGSYNFDDAHMRPSYRYEVEPAFRDIDVGWRCARVP